MDSYFNKIYRTPTWEVYCKQTNLPWDSIKSYVLFPTIVFERTELSFSIAFYLMNITWGFRYYG